MKHEYKHNNTTVFLLNYHFIFCSRYRRKVLIKDVALKFQVILSQICNEHNLKIVTVEIMPDYVHLLVNAPPSISPSEIMAKVKGATSRELRQEFSHLCHLPSIWTRSFFCSTAETVSSETIEKYINQQKKRG